MEILYIIYNGNNTDKDLMQCGAKNLFETMSNIHFLQT